ATTQLTQKGSPRIFLTRCFLKGTCPRQDLVQVLDGTFILSSQSPSPPDQTVLPCSPSSGLLGRSWEALGGPESTTQSSKQETDDKMKGRRRNVVNDLVKNRECLKVLLCQTLSVKPQFDKIFLDDGEDALVVFSDMDPPTIKCPSVKERIAEPNKLTVRVSWETPEGRDTADGILTDVTLKGLPPGSNFPEGDHKIEYTVYDRAENKGTCKFRVKVRVRRCGKLNAPENGYMKCSSDGDNYGATCEFSCIGGYELQGSPARVCQSNLAWSGTEPTCAAMNVNVGVRTAAALLDQFYEKRRLLIVSTPTARNLLYRLQLGMLQQAQCGLDLRHITVVELVGVFPTLIGRIRAKIILLFFACLRLLLRIPLYSFSMVLVDKHGMDKERYVSLVTPMALFNLIDTFPLRKEEMILQAEMGQTCST
uniref:Sushi repeat-containing protein SRPX n=1 Tax=Castor canadensis TaxID=51338 RepID=A0A8C0W744_CASCN